MNSITRHTFVAFTAVLLLAPLAALYAADAPKPADDVTSATDERLAKLLKRFPEADLNKDGILTRQEALQYRNKMQSSGNAAVGKEAKSKKAFNGPQPDVADLAYGPHPNNKLGSDEAMRFYPQSTWPGFYGLTTLDDLQTEKGKQLRADVDMLGLISKDDPPVWLGAGEGHDALASKGDTNHSPKHSEAIKKRCDEVGVRAVLKIGTTVRADADGNQSQIEFLLKHLRATTSEKN